MSFLPFAPRKPSEVLVILVTRSRGNKDLKMVPFKQALSRDRRSDFLKYKSPSTLHVVRFALCGFSRGF